MPVEFNPFLTPIKSDVSNKIKNKSPVLILAFLPITHEYPLSHFWGGGH